MMFRRYDIADFAYVFWFIEFLTRLFGPFDTFCHMRFDRVSLLPSSVKIAKTPWTTVEGLPDCRWPCSELIEGGTG